MLEYIVRIMVSRTAEEGPASTKGGHKSHNRGGILKKKILPFNGEHPKVKVEEIPGGNRTKIKEWCSWGGGGGGWGGGGGGGGKASQ